MTRRMFTDEEKLEVLEDILDETRTSGTWSCDEDEADVLKSICAEIRAGSKPPSQTLEALSFQVNAATRTKARIGYVEVGQFQAVAEGLIAHWPVVRLALERLAERANEKETAG